MPFPIIPAGTKASSGYQISRSLRFRSSASAYLSRTFATPTSTTIWTFSAWVKRGALGSAQRLMGASTTTYLTFDSSDKLNLTLNGTSAATSTAVFRDPSAWYHVVYQQNGSAQTIWVNNNSVATGTTAAAVFNTAIAHQIGAANTSNYFDGYMADVYFVDGSAKQPSDFGANDATTGVWGPKAYTGTYGTNGFYLKFTDIGATSGSNAGYGKDFAGTNYWTTNNLSSTAGVTYDSMIDTPTPYDDGGNGIGNYCVLNSLSKVTTSVLADANLSTTSVAAQIAIGSIGVTSGKWYWECAFSAATSTQKVGVYGTSASTATVTATTNTIGLRFDAGTGALDYTTDGTNYTSIATGLTSGPYFPYIESATNAKVMYANFGQRPFTYTPPSGFKALNTQNLPTPVIVAGSAHMNVALDTGANIKTTSQALYTYYLEWIKDRANVNNHQLADTVRGNTAILQSNSTGAETTYSAPSGNSVGWVWNAGSAKVTGYQPSGATIACDYAANVTAGFSVVTWTGNTTANSTVGHGLGVPVDFAIVKNRNTAGNGWLVWHRSVTSGNGKYLYLDLTNGIGGPAGTPVWDSSNTSTQSSISTFTIGANSMVNSGNMLMYCFAAVSGYSAFGSYTGNGSADGPFVFTGFRPRFVMVKATTAISGNWVIIDTARLTYNQNGTGLYPNLSNFEITTAYIDILSNGFKIRNNSTNMNNTSSDTYIWAAFAENPMKYSLAG